MPAERLLGVLELRILFNPPSKLVVFAVTEAIVFRCERKQILPSDLLCIILYFFDP
jgi:hypothetical protein